MSKNKEVVKEEKSTAIEAYDYSAYAGVGFEEHTQEDYSVPFLGVIQPTSPIIETNADARPGMLINTVTQDLYDSKTGVVFIPAATQHKFIEWVPRDSGGGFVAVRELNDPVVLKAKDEQEFGKYKIDKNDPKSNDLIETYYVYGILVKEDGSSQQIIIAFTSTKIGTYKKWMTKAQSIQIKLPDDRRIVAPLFSHKYRITTVSLKNAKGTYYNFVIGYDGKEAIDCRLAPSSQYFQEAEAFRALILSGGVKTAEETQSAVHSEETAEQSPFK